MKISDQKGSEKKRSYHHGDLRTALIESALDIIEELGPRKLTVREVAHRAGVSHAAPYRHFKDKNELINAVVERGFELLQETMARELNTAGDDALGCICGKWSRLSRVRPKVSGVLRRHVQRRSSRPRWQSDATTHQPCSV
jgi:AcrR family transcriptional regulator